MKNIRFFALTRFGGIQINFSFSTSNSICSYLMLRKVIVSSIKKLKEASKFKSNIFKCDFEWRSSAHLYNNMVGKMVERCHNECASSTQNNGGKSVSSSNSEMPTSTWNRRIFHAYGLRLRCSTYHPIQPTPVAMPVKTLAFILYA